MIALAVIVGLLATKTQARADGYICVVEGIYDIDEQGRLETFYRPPEVMTFSVSRVTGEIIGDAVSTERAKTTVVINRGDSKWSFRATADFGEWFQLIVVEEFNDSSEKPFIVVTHAAPSIYTGVCRRLRASGPTGNSSWQTRFAPVRASVAVAAG